MMRDLHGALSPSQLCACVAVQCLTARFFEERCDEAQEVVDSILAARIPS